MDTFADAARQVVSKPRQPPPLLPHGSRRLREPGGAVADVLGSASTHGDASERERPVHDLPARVSMDPLRATDRYRLVMPYESL